MLAVRDTMADDMACFINQSNTDYLDINQEIYSVSVSVLGLCQGGTVGRVNDFKTQGRTVCVCEHMFSCEYRMVKQIMYMCGNYFVYCHHRQNIIMSMTVKDLQYHTCTSILVYMAIAQHLRYGTTSDFYCITLALLPD